MNIFKAFAIAFSLYSQIPMPQFEWEDKDMKYSLIFFPWVGALIGAVLLGVYFVGIKIGIPEIGILLLMIAIPLIITGGFHVDGYMDTQDALKSYGEKEKKLEILSDPHIGAFSVIKLVTNGLIFASALSVLVFKHDELGIIFFAFCFVIARLFSAFGVIFLKPAKNKGMLSKEARVSKIVKYILAAELIILLLAMFYLDYRMAILSVLVCVSSFGYYRYISYKNFGGITGDTAGYFVVVTETFMVVMLAIFRICLEIF